MTKKKITFEEELNRLQEISELLESDEIGLDESVSLYEEGMKLSTRCYGQLKKAELKVTELKKKMEDDFSEEFDFE
ncbi:MAG: exodeoxyribonuclease VII small subunit [Melioribacteraceae bacterium]|nr:exodeoxyribonuclease VII small subunit [Melioribacteraceae bacterium]